MAYALVDADGHVLRAFDAERVFYSAATVKLGVLIAALREVRQHVRGIGVTKGAKAAIEAAGGSLVDQPVQADSKPTKKAVEKEKAVDKAAKIAAKTAAKESPKDSAKETGNKPRKQKKSAEGS